MKILVTGAAGFVGYHVARRLVGRGDEVVGLDNINDYYDVALKYGRLAELGFSAETAAGADVPVDSSRFEALRFVRMDLADAERLSDLFAAERFDAVCTLAAQAGVRYSLVNPQAYVTSNMQGFFNILEAARNNPVEHLVYASSSSVYGLNSEVPFRESSAADHPASLYAASKRANELTAHSYSHLFGIPTTGLRFFTVYGPWGRPDMAPILFTKAMLAGEPIRVFNHGDMSRDFTYIDDIVEGVVRVIDTPATGESASTERSVPPESPESSAESSAALGERSVPGAADPAPASPAAPAAPGAHASAPAAADPPAAARSDRSSAPWRIYNIGNGAPVHLLDFIRALERELGITAEKSFEPMQPGDVPATWADCSALEQAVGYRPDTSIEQGIHEFVRWYRGFYGV